VFSDTLQNCLGTKFAHTSHFDNIEYHSHEIAPVTVFRIISYIISNIQHSRFDESVFLLSKVHRYGAATQNGGSTASHRSRGHHFHFIGKKDTLHLLNFECGHSRFGF
jgi:hypothetical protein